MKTTTKPFPWILIGVLTVLATVILGGVGSLIVYSMVLESRKEARRELLRREPWREQIEENMRQGR